MTKKIQEFNNKLVVHLKSTMNEDYKRGRPYGGMGWIVNKKWLKSVMTIRDLSDLVSVCSFKTMTIIGVYAKCNGAKTDENDQDNDEIMDLIASIAAQEEQCGRTVMVIGYFNADLRRTGQNDRALKRLVNENDLIVADMRNALTTSWTFREGQKRSHIDHVLVKPNRATSIIDTLVLDEPQNLSDHRAISCRIETDKLESTSCSNSKRSRINWDSLATRLEYKDKINEAMRAIDPRILEQETLTSDQVDGVLEEMYRAIRSVTAGITSASRPAGPKRKRKPWWDATSDRLIEQVKVAYLG